MALSWFEILLIAVGLAMDAFAVSVGGGTTGMLARLRPTIRLAFHLGLFQALMPILGWYLGASLAGFIVVVDHWLAFALLAFVGSRMIHSGCYPDQTATPSNPSRGLTMVALSVATSIDAFAVGLSLALVGVAIVAPAIIIGVVTMLLSVIGARLGERLGRSFGAKAELAGGIILILIGLRILISHLIP